MNATLLAALNDAERLLVAETEPAALAALDEDAALALHDRIRRARNKYVGQYRRGASAKVGKARGRGAARPTNTAARTKAEAFEEALGRVSRRLSTLAKESAAALRTERLDAARSTKARPPAKPAAGTSARPGSRSRTAAARSGDRAVRSPRTEKNRASAKAAGARRQAKRDSR